MNRESVESDSIEIFLCNECGSSEMSQGKIISLIRASQQDGPPWILSTHVSTP